MLVVLVVLVLVADLASPPQGVRAQAGHRAGAGLQVQREGADQVTVAAIIATNIALPTVTPWPGT